jgi:predicted DNA-binding protein (UPF0251 family)
MIWRWPCTTYFRPGLTSYDEIILTLDELEALRLKDLEELTQEEAAKRMNISQPTFNRLLSSARKKVSDALVKGKAIRIEGGDVTIRGFGGPPKYCICPVCGRKQIKLRGVPCAKMKCERCGAIMIRG